MRNVSFSLGSLFFDCSDDIFLAYVNVYLACRGARGTTGRSSIVTSAASTGESCVCLQLPSNHTRWLASPYLYIYWLRDSMGMSQRFDYLTADIADRFEGFRDIGRCHRVSILTVRLRIYCVSPMQNAGDRAESEEKWQVYHV